MSARSNAPPHRARSESHCDHAAPPRAHKHAARAAAPRTHRAHTPGVRLGRRALALARERRVHVAPQHRRRVLLGVCWSGCVSGGALSLPAWLRNACAPPLFSRPLISAPLSLSLTRVARLRPRRLLLRRRLHCVECVVGERACASQALTRVAAAPHALASALLSSRFGRDAYAARRRLLMLAEADGACSERVAPGSCAHLRASEERPSGTDNFQKTQPRSNACAPLCPIAAQIAATSGACSRRPLAARSCSLSLSVRAPTSRHRFKRARSGVASCCAHSSGAHMIDT